MYLKSIELYGFKSFAERAQINFRDGIAGIVGPNGSGKSNITDAVRWVLGEQSAKVLRGSKMEDLIFSGTDRRKQLGMAEVSLTFDNSSGNLPIEYGEVVVKRRVYRSGDSEYLINNNPCKMRDIKELFMDTGIGIDGYSIIGQGRIDSILSSKSDDRRKLFEEAAGIVKFKTRKENTGKKLERTNQNILRVEDILNELEMRIEPLRIESEKAKSHELLYGELKNLEISLFMEEIDRINEKMKTNREKLEAVELSITSLELSKDETKQELHKTEETLVELRRDVQNEEKKLAEINERRNQLNYEMELSSERKRTAEKERAGKAVQLESNKNKIESLKNSYEIKIRERDSIDERETALKRDFKSFSERISCLSDEMESVKKLLENEKIKVFEDLNKSSELRSEIASLNSYEKSISARVERLNEEKSEADELLRSKSIEINECENSLETAENNKREAEADCETKMETLEERQKSEIEKSVLLNELLREAKTLEDKKNLYSKLINNYEGFNSSVKNSLKALRGNSLSKHIEGTVSEIIKVEKAYEIAIETALGFSSQHIICDTVESAKKIIDFVKKEKTGRITLLPMNDVRGGKRGKVALPADKGVVGSAKELIQYDVRFENIIDFILGNIIVVEDSSVAVRLINNGFRGRRMITLDGDVFNPGGTITGGSMKGRSTGLLSRKRILEETVSSLDSKRSSYHLAKEELERITHLKLEDGKALEEAKGIFADCEREVERLSRQIDISQTSIQALEDKRNSLIREIGAIEIEGAKIEKEKNSIKDKIKNVEALNTDNEKSIGELEKSEKKYVLEIGELKDLINANKVNLAIMVEKGNAIKHEMERIEESIESMESDSSDHARLMEELGIKIDSYERDIAEKHELFELIAHESSECKKTIESGRMSINEKAAMARRLQDETDKIESNIIMEKDRFHKLELSDTRNQINYDHFIKQLWEVYQLSYIEAMDARVKIENRSAMIKRIEVLKAEIDLLGDINRASIKEYEEVNHRYEFLGNQKTDLLEAKETLEDLIVKLESKMVKIFKEEIKVINSNFNRTFNQLFNGGRAEIIFEDTDDILNSHIDIYAEPPGKKLQNLNLLSGGEKSLTAIAMLFAILMKKPSPFCVLDEIEAALDDVNVYRFASFLKKFSDQSQFILITHRKGTMEIADVLYGVTMEEKGISKIVSLEIKNKAS